MTRTTTQEAPSRLEVLARWSNQPFWLRAMLVVEVLIFIGVVSMYLWYLPSKGVTFFDAFAWVMAFVWPIGLNLLHGDTPPDSGIRRDTMVEGFWRCGIVTGLMASGLVITGLIMNSLKFDNPLRMLERFGGYIIWGLLQQYWLHAFSLRRLRQAGLGDIAAVLCASAFFGILHAPNWPLVGLTFGAGLVWCVVFLQSRNLLPLALSHAALGVLTYFCLPVEWTNRLTVGGLFLREIGAG